MTASQFAPSEDFTKPTLSIQIRITGRELKSTLTTDMRREYLFQETFVEIYSSDSKHEAKESIALNKINHKTKSIFDLVSQDCPVVFYFEKDGIKTQLPQSMTKNLVVFFKQYKPPYKPYYCCINFAYEMLYGRDVIFHDNSIFGFQRERFPKEPDFSPGNTVYLFQQHPTLASNRKHLAIYIGNKSYLSLFGNRGALTITSLNEMNKAWGTVSCEEIRKPSEAKKHPESVKKTPPPKTKENALLSFAKSIKFYFFGNKQDPIGGLRQKTPNPPYSLPVSLK